MFAQTPEWIWSAKYQETETRYFRKNFSLPSVPTKAALTVACDNGAEVEINGVGAARNSDWASATRANVARRLVAGDNALRVKARNEGGPAGLLLRLELEFADGSKRTLVSDKSWETSADGQGNWLAATSLGELGVQPWGNPLRPAAAPPAESLTVLPGFRVELLRSSQPGEGSWVAMTVDAKGRLILSPQGSEPMLRVTLDAAGQVASLEPIELPVSGAMGLLYAHDSLFVNGQGPDGYHLYRLSDTNGDDRYDQVKLVHRWKGGPGEHGAHGIVSGPDGKLYIVNGNFVDVPDDIAPTSPHRNYADDLALPRLEDGNGFGAGRKPPGGYVVRMNPDGTQCELFASGQRNTYDIAFNPAGELFGFDSDMEWDWGTPWYRPIRVFQVVSGGDQGFREGSAKWPSFYPDSLPETVNIGIGSPTGVRFGTGAKFSRKYQDALYVLDWSYGRIVAVHLNPQGAGFTGTFETFVKGKPLNVTDIEVGRDGAMYFTIGGRGTQAGLYRVTQIDPGSSGAAPALAGEAERRQRRELESLHGRAVSGAVQKIWEPLGKPDRFLRYAARVALESQPVGDWREQALSETDARRGLTALLALARVGTAEDQPRLLKALGRWPLDTLDEELFLLKLRVVEVSVARHGLPSSELRQVAVEKLGRQFPAASWPKNRELSQLLVAFEAPDAVSKILALRDTAATQEEQVHYQAILRLAKVGWDAASRQRYFAWFHLRAGPKADAPVAAAGQLMAAQTAHPAEFNQWFQDVGLNAGNGASYANFLKNIRQQAADRLALEERNALAGWISGSVFTSPVKPTEVIKQRPFVKDWKVADLEPVLSRASAGRNFNLGREVFHAAQCVACHRFNGEGGAIGPDLTGVSSRFSRLDIVRSILEPSAVVSEQYYNLTFTLKDGDEVTGRLIEEGGDKVVVLVDPLNNVRRDLPKADIRERHASKLSPMPEGLVSMLTQDELLDLLAYLESNGVATGAAFAR